MLQTVKTYVIGIKDYERGGDGGWAYFLDFATTLEDEE